MVIEFLQWISVFISVTKCQDKVTILGAIPNKNVSLIIFPSVLPLVFNSQILLEVLDQRKGHKVLFLFMNEPSQETVCSACHVSFSYVTDL